MNALVEERKIMSGAINRTEEVAFATAKLAFDLEVFSYQSLVTEITHMRKQEDLLSYWGVRPLAPAGETAPITENAEEAASTPAAT